MLPKILIPDRSSDFTNENIIHWLDIFSRFWPDDKPMILIGPDLKFKAIELLAGGKMCYFITNIVGMDSWFLGSETLINRVNGIESFEWNA